jgi:large subunit ribosomal protein L31
MKKNIHPTMSPTVFIDAATGQKIITSSTITGGDTMDIDGVTYQVVRSDITSYSHPFFTGEMRFVDEKGQVDRFKKRMENAAKKQAAKTQKSKGKKKDEEPAGDPRSYRDLLREQHDVLRKNKSTQA